jgi:uncharacterized membrane protein YraQ (UPF0718 family)
MPEIVFRELVYFWLFFSIQVSQIAPYWAFGIFLGSLVSVFGKQKMHSLLGAMQKKKLGIAGIIPASVLGIASPLCMYGTIPIAASFAEGGMEEDWLAAFMMSSILLNPQLMIYSAALGNAVLLIRFISCLLCGISAGLLVRCFFSGKKYFNFTGFYKNVSPGIIAGRDTDQNLMLRFLKNLLRNVKVTGPAFLLGITLSALFQRYVPADTVAVLFGRHRAFGILMAASVGVPLYVCGGGTIPLLRSWMENGMSLGSASAFMISGPAMKITNLGALKIILGIGHFTIYIAFVLFFALLMGFLIDFV